MTADVVQDGFDDVARNGAAIGAGERFDFG
jgi:hypothetical protein